MNFRISTFLLKITHKLHIFMYMYVCTLLVTLRILNYLLLQFTFISQQFHI